MQAYDLLIVGGGINGAAVARDAAGRGLSVCLLDAGDPGGATSWASSKLIHGGLRYLEQYAFGLVRESLQERATLMRIAPHLTRPCRFVLPHTPEQRPAWMIQLGLWLYDHIGGSGALPAATRIRLDDGSEWAAPLKPGYQQGFVYFDVQVDDARLVILTLRDAEARGADILTHARFVGAQREVDGDWVCRVQSNGSNGNDTQVRAKAIVNAAGPWVAKVLDTLDGGHNSSHPQVQLVRGSHIVVPRCHAGDHAYTLQNDDGRVIFLLPFHTQWTLIGTTDVRADAPSPSPEASEAEVAYLLRAANRYLAQPLSEADIVWRFAGLRPLYDDGKANPSRVTRDYKLVLDAAQDTPLLSIFGGKLTTHRHLAEEVLHTLSQWFPHLGTPWTAGTPLPGGDGDFTAATAEFFQAFHHLPGIIVEGLWARHGTLAFGLLENVNSSADLGRDFGAGLCELEAIHFIRNEWAHSADDILWRRTKAGLAMSAQQQQDFAQWFAENHPQHQQHRNTENKASA
ncbi:MAG: glycerol-3-phosphate dehydrogenase [Rhodocyclaceae bacterium]|nr:glycerol-3-phosphate dehydrogenase [Rhodocyclaceae bacterium]